MKKRRFKLYNVNKETDNEVKANKLLDQGFIEVNKKGEEIKDESDEDLKVELEETKKELEKVEKELQDIRSEKEKTKESSSKKGDKK